MLWKRDYLHKGSYTAPAFQLIKGLESSYKKKLRDVGENKNRLHRSRGYQKLQKDTLAYLIKHEEMIKSVNMCTFSI